MRTFNPAPGETLHTIKQAAAQSGYSDKHLQGMVHRGQLPVHVRYVGERRYRMVRLSDVLAWRDREAFRPSDPESAREALDRWITVHKSELKAARYGEGTHYYRLFIAETGHDVALQYFYSLMNARGFYFKKGHTGLARKFIKKFPSLAHEPITKGRAEFERYTGVAIDPRLWRQAVTEYRQWLESEHD